MTKHKLEEPMNQLLAVAYHDISYPGWSYFC